MRNGVWCLGLSLSLKSEEGSESTVIASFSVGASCAAVSSVFSSVAAAAAATYKIDTGELADKVKPHLQALGTQILTRLYSTTRHRNSHYSDTCREVVHDDSDIPVYYHILLAFRKKKVAIYMCTICMALCRRR